MKSILLIVILCLPVLANEPSLRDLNWQITPPALDVPVTQSIRLSQPVKPPHERLTFWLAVAANHASVEFDRYSTYAVPKRCPGCYEANPFVRGVIDSKIKTAAVMHGLTLISDVASYLLLRKGVKVWSIPIGVSIGMHSAAAIHNSRLK